MCSGNFYVDNLLLKNERFMRRYLNLKMLSNDMHASNGNVVVLGNIKTLM